MPRVGHRKTRTGCRICKGRKIKCDEGKPRCLNCSGHNLPCEYGAETHLPRGVQQRPLPPAAESPYYPNATQDGPREQVLDPSLELQLMHEWTANTCTSFSTAWKFWCYQAPLIAMQHRYLLDAMFAMAALYASKHPPTRWNPIEGRMMSASEVDYNPNVSKHDVDPYWKDLHQKSVLDSVVHILKQPPTITGIRSRPSGEMLGLSRMYLTRALEGFRAAVDSMTVENAEAVFTTSILIAFSALFALGESEEDSTLPPLDASFWIRFGRGNYHVIQRWRELVGEKWIASSGIFYGQPDLSDDEWIFSPDHAKPFEKLLTFAEEYETLTDEDKNAYLRTLAYLGVLYSGIVDGTESSLATCRRLSAMPPKVPPRFIDFVEARQPRAMVILAHVFASMRLVQDENMWFSGVAERQVPKIFEEIPVGWRPMMAWPMAVAQGEISRMPEEAQVDGAASLKSHN